MDVGKISPGHAPPRDINVLVEIPQGSVVKYEVDEASGAMFVDRFLFTSTAYPAAYGFIPGTFGADGDPLDALVLTPAAVVPGAVIRARPIGMLHMEDEAGPDEKIICVPHDQVHPQYSAVETLDDLPPITRAAIEQFFRTYKELEGGKWAKVLGWGDKAEAESRIMASLASGWPATDDAKCLYVVIRRYGPPYESGKPLEAQLEWEEHRVFMNALEAEGVARLAGPLEGSNEVLLILRAVSEDDVERRLGADPWSRSGILTTTRVARWNLRVGEVG